MNLLSRMSGNVSVMVGLTLLSGVLVIAGSPGSEQNLTSSPELHRVVVDYPNDTLPVLSKPAYLDHEIVTADSGQIELIVTRPAVSSAIAIHRFYPWEQPSVPVPVSSVPVPVSSVPVPVSSVPVPVPLAGDRPVVLADASTVLDQPNTIYDFGFGSPGNVVILASNVEARNIRGAGLRRIGERNGVSITDSGFRDFEFTFANIHMSDGANITRPYFIYGTDVNVQPNTGDGDIIQIFAYQGNIISPLIEGITIYGKQRPSGSLAHNDGIQFTGIQGGKIFNPTIRNSTIFGASSAAVQIAEVYGLLTIEGSRLSERFGSYHAVIATKPTPGVSVLWRNNTLLDGSSAAFLGGWTLHPSSNGITDNITIR